MKLVLKNIEATYRSRLKNRSYLFDDRRRRALAFGRGYSQSYEWHRWSWSTGQLESNWRP
jgi:hypothetical protein